MSRSAGGSRLGTVLRHLLLVLAAIIVLFPFVWIGAAAFKTQISLLLGQILFQPVLMNFEAVLTARSSDYVRNFTNSLTVGLLSTVLVLVVATLAAYSLNRMRWPRWVGRSMLGWAIVFHMVPPITLAGAWYSMFRPLGLDNSYLGLVLAHTTQNLPMALWMMSDFVNDVPEELHETRPTVWLGTFDVADGAKVVFGPAKRPLPQLPITVDDEGYLVAQSDFHEPIGPSFWERLR